MNIQERYQSFKCVYVNSDLTYEQWLEITHWNERAVGLTHLEMCIFPDGIVSLIYENSPLRTISLCSGQNSLRDLALDGTYVESVVVPDNVKGIETIHLSNCPITKLDLGGSTETITSLSLVVFATGFSVPKGMINLETLAITSLVGDITLPDDLVSLKVLHVTTPKTITNPNSKGTFTVPTSMVELRTFSFRGAKYNIALNERLPLLGTVRIEIDGNPKKITISPNLLSNATSINAVKYTGEIDVSTTLGIEISSLHVSTVGVSIKLPIMGGKLTSLSILGGPRLNIVIPENYPNLRALMLRAKTIEVLPTLSHLTTLRVLGSTITIPHTDTLTSLQSLNLSNKCKLIGTLPLKMPHLKYIHTGKNSGLDKWLMEKHPDCVTSGSF